MARFSSLFRAVPVSATLIALGVLAVPTGASAEFKLPKCSPNCFGKSSAPQPIIIPKFGNKFNYGLGKVGYGPGNKFGGGWGHKHGGGWGHKHGGGWGYGAAALGGMAVGLVAAGAASANAGTYGGQAYAGECYLVRRQAVDEDGNVYIRRVRVCE